MKVYALALPSLFFQDMIKALIFCALIASTLASTKCKVNGKEYANRETWIDNKREFKWKCYASPNIWKAVPIACITDKGSEVWPHDIRVEDGVLYSCHEAGYELLESRRRVV